MIVKLETGPLDSTYAITNVKKYNPCSQKSKLAISGVTYSPYWIWMLLFVRHKTEGNNK
jgi:hypothetical protein